MNTRTIKPHREKGTVFTEMRNNRALNQRLTRLGALKIKDVAELLKEDFSYQQVRMGVCMMMEEKIKRGEAEKLANGLYWIKKNKYCLN